LVSHGFGEDIFEDMAAVDALMGEDAAISNKRARSQEEMDQRKQALDNEPDAFKKMMMQHVWNTEESNETLKAVMETTKTDIKKIDGTLKDHSERMNRSDARADLMEQQIKKLVAGSSMASTSGGTGDNNGGGSSNVRSNLNPGQSGPSIFTPSFVEIKGWVTDWSHQANRTAQMIPWADAYQLIQNLVGTLAKADADQVDLTKTERLNGGRYMYGSVRIGFKDGTCRDTLWSVKSRADQICKPVNQRAPGLGIPRGYEALEAPAPTSLTENLDATIDATRLRTVVECPPWKKDHVKAVARFCGTWRSLTQSLVNIEIRGEIGPPRSQIWTKATALVKPICFAEFTTATGVWRIHADSFARIVAAYPALTVPSATLVDEVNRRQ